MQETLAVFSKPDAEVSGDSTKNVGRKTKTSTTKGKSTAGKVVPTKKKPAQEEPVSEEVVAFLTKLCFIESNKCFTNLIKSGKDLRSLSIIVECKDTKYPKGTRPSFTKQPYFIYPEDQDPKEEFTMICNVKENVIDFMVKVLEMQYSRKGFKVNVSRKSQINQEEVNITTSGASYILSVSY